MVDEFRRPCVCYRGNSTLYQGMMSAAITPRSLTSRTFADSPGGKDSPRGVRAGALLKDRRRAEFNSVLQLRK
eukprot:2785225-Pleurochrysis_carterae.AAC.1